MHCTFTLYSDLKSLIKQYGSIAECHALAQHIMLRGDARGAAARGLLYSSVEGWGFC